MLQSWGVDFERRLGGRKGSVKDNFHLRLWKIRDVWSLIRLGTKSHDTSASATSTLTIFEKNKTKQKLSLVRLTKGTH